MEHWMLEHKYLVDVAFFILILGLVWLIIRYRFKDTYVSIKELKPIYRILIYTAIAAIVYLFMILVSKFSLVTLIVVIGLPGALLAFLI